MAKPDRIPCIVPFCRRTAPIEKFGEGTEIICHRHYRSVSRKLRALYSKVAREVRRNHETYQGILPPDVKLAARILKRDAQVDRLWKRIKVEAIEIAGGIR